MSKVLVEVDAFTADVTVPEDDDPQDAASVETGFQTLANRTKNLNRRTAPLEMYAAYTVSASAIASGAKCTLAEQVENGGFVLASNEITFPELGVYQISLMARMTVNPGTNPLLTGLLLYGEEARGFRNSGTAGDSIMVHCSATIQVTDLAVTLKVTAEDTGTTVQTAGSRLNIRRLA